jgi:A/G-specific adenine glycosylase
MKRRKRASQPSRPRGADLSADLLVWYDRHRRKLPWRALPGERPDPYRVWLSEIMLQQTTIKAVVPYFARFAARWPSVRALAAAPLEEVLKLWAARAVSARLRQGGGRAPWRRLSAKPSDARRAARHRPLYGGGDRGDRV